MAGYGHLAPAKIREIRTALRSGMTKAEVGEKLRVSRSRIEQVAQYQTITCLCGTEFIQFLHPRKGWGIMRRCAECAERLWRHERGQLARYKGLPQ